MNKVKFYILQVITLSLFAFVVISGSQTVRAIEPEGNKDKETTINQENSKNQSEGEQTDRVSVKERVKTYEKMIESQKQVTHKKTNTKKDTTEKESTELSSTSSTEVTTWDKLPTELKMEIMSYCSVSDLCRGKTVSHQYRDIANYLLAPTKKEEATIRGIYNNIRNFEFGYGSKREEIIKKSPVLAERFAKEEQYHFPYSYIDCPENDVTLFMNHDMVIDNNMVALVMFNRKDKLVGLTVPKVQTALDLDFELILQIGWLKYPLEYRNIVFDYNKKTGEIIDVEIFGNVHYKPPIKPKYIL